jgi:predicted P-loop ATPase
MTRNNDSRGKTQAAYSSLPNAELAKRLAEAGVEIFPCLEKQDGKKKAKAPYTAKGFKTASSDVVQVIKWWARWPDALIGLKPGDEGALVVDMDIKSGIDGVENFRELIPDFEDRFPCAITPSGGMHAWMQKAEDFHGNGTGDLPAGIDIRSDNGYVCLGTMADGRRYEADEVIAWLLSGREWPDMPGEVEKALTRGNSHEKRASVSEIALHKPYSDNYQPVDLGEALDAHPDLWKWRGVTGEGDTSPSEQFASLFYVTVDAILKVHNRAFDRLDQQDLARNIYELMRDLLSDTDFGGECADAAHDHMRRRGSYSITRLMKTVEPDRAPIDIQHREAFQTVAEYIKGKGGGQGEDALPLWEEDPKEAIKAACRKIVKSGIRESDPLAFKEVCDDLTATAKNYGEDITAKLPGTRRTVLEAALRAESVALAEEAKERKRRDKAKRDTVAFPHIGEDYLPRKDSLPNAVAWIEQSELDVWQDEFSDETMLHKRPIGDSDMLAVREGMHKDEFFASSALVKDALIRVAWNNRRHPVREYFEDVANDWDGRKRLDTWLIDYCGAPDNAAWREVSRLVLIAIVMRARRPGAKFDHILSLIGPEGLGKSTLCRVLAIKPAWWLEGFQLSWSQKEMLERTAGCIVAEYGEMSGHTQKEQSSLKDAASRTKDRARKAYGHFAETRERSFIVIANSNEVAPLVSKWGNRRFWPLHINEHIDIEGLEHVLDQLYGEAVHAQEAWLEDRGQDIVLAKEHWEYFADLQEDARYISSVEDKTMHVFDGIENGHISVSDAYEIINIRYQDKNALGDIVHALERLGWKKRSKIRMKGDKNSQSYFTIGKDYQKTRIRVDSTMGERRLIFEDIDTGKVLKFPRK